MMNTQKTQIIEMNTLEEKLELGYKRMAIISMIWSIIPLPFIFFVDEKFLFFFVYFEMLWINIGILCSVKLVKKLWKNKNI